MSKQGLLVFLGRFYRFMEFLNDLFHILAGNRGLVSNRVDLSLKHVRQCFQAVSFCQKLLPFFALNQRNVDVVLLAPPFAVDPDSLTDPQTDVPRNIKPQVDLRLAGAVGDLAEVIIGLCYDGKDCFFKYN